MTAKRVPPSSDTRADLTAEHRGPRRPAQPRRAFVFGGGGVLGFAWIVGALTALEHERGVVPAEEDLCVGTSAGAVIAALLGCGVDVDSIRRHQLGMPLPEDPPISWNYAADSGGALPPRPGWRPGSMRLAWGGIRHRHSVPPVVALSGLLPRGRGTLNPIHRMLDTVIEESGSDGGWPDRQTWVVATDYSSGRRVVFGRDGSPSAGLADAVCASCAIPAWYAPIQIGDGAYIDGGTASNASVDLIDPETVDEVYVLAPMAALEPDSPRSPVAMVERRVRKAITRGIVHDVQELQTSGVAVTMLTPGSEDLTAMGANLMNPRRRSDVLHTAMRTVAAQLHHTDLGRSDRQDGAGA
ncbi:patatin-like phospholipase family protein [Jatrophihabitans telluris]|uniref:Patatin-like phospholipase family protein n=1 Tax=Jatrophihabitans telluris TaxID=2038343 RepID=A0ABY4R195_9ACTN|nr:patatin-like phospholipase family protein [Jatrophihabitans telluris]UQX89696.1 patatin-like phospholipase family protein [Jatrophihabitans telluris]